MDELDQLFKSHKEAFDRLEPRSNSWTTIKEAVDKGNESDVEKHIHRPVHRRSLLKLAAALVLLLGVTSVWLLNWRGQQAKFDQIVLHSPQGEPVRLDPAQTNSPWYSSGPPVMLSVRRKIVITTCQPMKSTRITVSKFTLFRWTRTSTPGSTALKKITCPGFMCPTWKGGFPVCIECNITKVPSNFLLNHKGKIIARDLDAKDLEITLDRLLALQ